MRMEWGTSDANVQDFLTAYHLVTQRSYFRPFDKRHLIYAAIDGMLSATGDPHTMFLSPSQNQVANKALNGTEFTGIGAIVAPSGGNLQIVAPLPRTPASKAGLLAGDLVTHIDGVAVSRLGGGAAVTRIHGRVGTKVRLTVTRGSRPAFTVTVTRASIPPITAYGRMLPHNLGDLQILSFGDGTSGEVADALRYFAGQHAQGIILDLRGNPGGYVDAAQRVVSEFLARGVVAYEEGTDKKLHALNVLSGQQLTRLPVAVIVDAGTASAAEITAGALRDSGRAIVIGTRTYGKGSMQSIYALADGSTIRITDRLWLTPKKHSIQSVGIQPDMRVGAAISVHGVIEDAQLLAAERYLVHRGHA